MIYWLGIDTPRVWAEAEQKFNQNGPLLFGFPEGRRKSVQQMQIGDRIVNYMTKRKRFFAVWEITKGYSYNPTSTFADGVFPECVEVRRIVRLAPEEGIEYPGVRVRRSAVPLEDDDGERILSALNIAYHERDAINDIGTDTPDRVITTGIAYSRDPKIRDAVKKRAKGKCEFCGALGFKGVETPLRA